MDCDDPANQDLLLPQYRERIERYSQQDKFSEFCMGAGFLNVVEIGQYFITKDPADFSQFHAGGLSCMHSSKRRRSITTKRMGPREHQNRISHGSIKFVMNLNNNEAEIPEDQTRIICVKTECERFCMPIKCNSKTTKKRTCRLFTKNSHHWEKELDRC